MDYSWSELTRPIKVDLISDNDIKGSPDPNARFISLLTEKYPDHSVIYTDGSSSAERDRSSCSVVLPSILEWGIRLNDFSTVATCEAYGILSALKFIYQRQETRVLIVSDAKGILSGISDKLLGAGVHQLTHEIIRLIEKIENKNINLKFLWISSHCGIEVNDSADWLAKNALQFDFGRFNGLRCGHICSHEHFERMGWQIDMRCPCGMGQKNLLHYLRDCSVLSPGRPELFNFLNSRMVNFKLDLMDLIWPWSMVYSPSGKVIWEGRCHNIIPIMNFIYNDFL